MYAARGRWLFGHSKRFSLSCQPLFSNAAAVRYQHGFSKSLCSVQSLRNNLLSGNSSFHRRNTKEPAVAFAVATIVLAVENSSLSDDLDTCNMVNVPTTTESSGDNSTDGPTTQLPPPTDLTDYRLPGDIKPDAYDLHLLPDLITGNFEGRLNISFNVLTPTNTIKLHNNGLFIKEVRVPNLPNIPTFVQDTVHELIVINTGVELPVGPASLYIEFTGDMKNRIVGLYTSSYTTDEGVTRAMATSKFEPTYARQAFPCFDEPNMKAKFTVHLLKPNDTSYIALSNMPVAAETQVQNGVLVDFEESVEMSTYLSCFIVSDFQYKEKNLTNDTPFRVYATPGQINKTQHAVDVGSEVIEYYNEYFDIPYPLPKLDMAAIPDFVSGAMEHWGLVTFRETNLLYDPATSSTSSKQSIASVIAHELAHSWFGNLVTMDWWNDLWLNEGFASYIEFKGVDAVFPDWQMLDQFLIRELHPVLILDATQGSHPIVQTVITPDQITEIFDTISYNKGASILRMLEHTVGEDVFKNGVKAYLDAHRFGNAVTQDLWNEIQMLVGTSLNITKFMDTWTLQMGYPIVDVVSDGNDFVLTQKRYLTDTESEDNSGIDYKWNIPINYITNVNSAPQVHWFMNSDPELRIVKPAGATWVKFNYHQIGYYRVNYERDHWDTLVQHINEMSISDKTHLLEESFRIAESGQLSYEVPLSLSNYLKTEDNYIPWSVASTMFSKLDDYLSSSEYVALFREHVIDLVASAYGKLTWQESDADTHLQKHARVTILGVACSMGHAACLDEAKSRFEAWIQSPNPMELSQDLRSLIYNYGMASTTTANWNLVWNKFVAETDAAEKLKLLRGLSSINNPSLLTRLIERAKDETYIRSQDYFTCLQYIASNPIGRPLVWDYVRENWLALVERFTLNDRYLGRLIPSITGGFATNVKLEEMQAFFAKHSEAGAGAASRVSALETVDNNIKWLAKNKEAVENWIQNNAVARKV